MGDDEVETPSEMTAPVSKLAIDNPADFKFHAAYTAYAKAWEETPSDEDRGKLNALIQALAEDEANYGVFYSELSQFRGASSYRSRGRIRGQRKRDWRRKEAKKTRMARHKR
jgi:hypothetical protein